MKKMMAVTAMFCIFLCLMVPVVTATQDNKDFDWDNTDWSTFDWTDMEEADYYDSLCHWLENEASLHSLFMVNMYCPSASFYSLWRWTFERFAADPEAFICALALEDDAIQERIIDCVVWPVDIEWEEAVAVLESVRLSKADPKEAHVLLREMIAFAEEAHGVEIVNPKTSDPVGAVAAAMVLSGLGCCMMLRRKRRVNAPM